MDTYICDLDTTFGTGEIYVSAKSKKLAVDLMFNYLSNNFKDWIFDKKYIENNIYKLENNKPKYFFVTE